MQANGIKAVFNLPPAEAIKYMEQKGYKISFDWQDMQREAHAKAFTVAGVTTADLLKDIKELIVKAQKEGKSLETFKNDLIPILTKKGWAQPVEIERPDGSKKEVDLTAPWRMQIIYRNFEILLLPNIIENLLQLVPT